MWDGELVPTAAGRTSGAGPDRAVPHRRPARPAGRGSAGARRNPAPERPHPASDSTPPRTQPCPNLRVSRVWDGELVPTAAGRSSGAGPDRAVPHRRPARPAGRGSAGARRNPAPERPHPASDSTPPRTQPCPNLRVRYSSKVPLPTAWSGARWPPVRKAR
ncbi:hypothetical protein Scel_75020 [Streptomyces cellostaticus]|nr:hypothetical protein Scel_75020 [Streptomyces cellostaticus]